MTVLPEGARIAPSAARALQKALDCLSAGLLASAWNWTERARVELDSLTEGAGDGTQNEGQSIGERDGNAPIGPGAAMPDHD